MATTLKLHLAQLPPSPSPEKNLLRLERLLEKSSGEEADILVLPEMFMAFPQNGVTPYQLAITYGHDFTNGLTNLARQYSTAMVCGIWENVPGMEDKAANVAITVDSAGKIINRYQKIHLFDALGFNESRTVYAGNKLPQLFSIKGIICGMAICYDLRFPELFRHQALAGADVILVPAAWYDGENKMELWQTLLRARAIENTVYTAGVTFCQRPFTGHSAAFDPYGKTVAELGSEENIIAVEINKEQISRVRQKMPSLTHIRRDLTF